MFLSEGQIDKNKGNTGHTHLTTKRKQRFEIYSNPCISVTSKLVWITAPENTKLWLKLFFVSLLWDGPVFAHSLLKLQLLF